MEGSDDSDTPLCWIDCKKDILEKAIEIEIKEELDEDIIDINPDLDPKPDFIQYHKEIMAIDLLKYPIIYTTRLEEMNVFKRKFDDINIQSFTERVYEESKPKYIRASFETEQLSSHRRDGFEPSPLYCEMEKKISAINKKCVSQNFGNLTRQYSAKKVENCGTDKILNKIYNVKGVSVVLKDFRKTKYLPLKPKNALALLVKDKQLNTKDIFITTKGSKITQHYNLVCGEPLPTELTMVRLSEYVVCCWYAREKFFLSQNNNFNQHNNVVRLGRRPHGCVQNKCQCCCKDKLGVLSDSTNEFHLPHIIIVDAAIQNLKENIYNSISKISKTAGNTPLLNTQSNDPFKNIFSEKKPLSSPHKLIKETLNYNKPFIQKPKCGLTYEKKDNLKGKLIHLTNTKTKELEFYELDNDGNVCAHAEFKMRTVAHDYLLDFNKPKIVANICCWVKREIIISKLISKQLSDSAIKFIRRPHRCFPGECICCCYAPSVRRNQKTLLDISLIKGQHSLNYTMSDKLPKIASVTRGKNLSDNVSTVNEAMTEKATSVQKINLTQEAQVSENNTVNTSSQSNLHYSKINNPTSTSSNTNQKLNQCLNVNAIIERNGSKFIESVQIEKGTSATKQRIVTAILETFRNARLTIDNEGKVAAALNTPASTLSTIELKVLAHILSSAQNEVNNVLKNNSTEGNTAIKLSNFTQIDDRFLNTTEENPVREAIINNKIIMTPPLMIGDSLPTLVGLDKDMLLDFHHKLESKQDQLQHSFHSFKNNLHYECDTDETTKVPQIQNVYSLNDKNKSNKDQTAASSSATMWYIEPKKKKSPQCSILKKRMNLMLKSDLLSSRALLKYKSSGELKRKSTDDLQTLSERHAPVKILNSSISDTDTNSKTRMSRYQIISSNDSKELKSPNDITLVKSNTKSVPSQIDCSPAHTLPTQSNPTVINMTFEGTEFNTPKVSVGPHKFIEHPVIRLKETRQTSDLAAAKKIRSIDLKHSMVPTPIAPKPMILPLDKMFKIIVPADTPAKAEMFSRTNTNQGNCDVFNKSSTEIKTESGDAINVNGSGDTEAADQDVEFVIKIGDDNLNVKITENVNDSATIDGSVINADPIVIIDDVDNNSVIAGNTSNDGEECILGV